MFQRISSRTQKSLKIDQGSNKHAGIDNDNIPETFDTWTQSWSEQECDTDFLGTTGRREVQLAHKQEMAGATTQWGFLFAPPPHHTIPHFSLTHLCLWSLKITVLILLSPADPPPTPPTLLALRYLCSYSSLRILIGAHSTHPILTVRLCQKLECKQEVINQWRVPFTRKTNSGDVPRFSWATYC